MVSFVEGMVLCDSGTRRGRNCHRTTDEHSRIPQNGLVILGDGSYFLLVHGNRLQSSNTAVREEITMLEILFELLDRFSYGFVFALTMGLIRFFFAA